MSNIHDESKFILFSFFLWPLCCLFLEIRFWLPLWYLQTLLMNNNPYSKNILPKGWIRRYKNSIVIITIMLTNGISISEMAMNLFLFAHIYPSQKLTRLLPNLTMGNTTDVLKQTETTYLCEHLESPSV